MKRLAIFISLFVFAIVSYGQTDISVSGLKGNYADEEKFDVNANETYSFFYGAAADTVSDNDTIWSKSYIIENVYEELEHECRVSLDSVSGTPTLNVALQGKWSENDSWSSLANADWAGSSSDTTITLQNTTAKNYRFLRVYIDADDTAQKSEVELIELGIYTP